MMTLMEGQTLWFVGNEMSNFKHVHGEVQVTKVGRKWADVTGAFKGRIDVDRLHADGGGYSRPGTCYASKLEWLNQEGPELAWAALRRALLAQCPEDLSYESILDAAKLMGVKLDLPHLSEQ